MSELKNCPFCGGEAFLATVEHSEESRPNGYRFHSQVMCRKCQASCGTTGFDETKEIADRKAIAAWNRRALLTCDGCMYENLRYPDDHMCANCKRLSPDYYQKRS